MTVWGQVGERVLGDFLFSSLQASKVHAGEFAGEFAGVGTTKTLQTPHLHGFLAPARGLELPDLLFQQKPRIQIFLGKALHFKILQLF